MSFKNHWSSAKESNNQINKLEENTTYNIKDVEKIQTSFGKRYVLIDEEDNKWWPNKSVEQFIHEHKSTKKFKLITSEFKTFKNKKGEDIIYLDVDIDF